MSDSQKPTVAIDFDGVVHKYTTPFEEFDVIPDSIVPGIKDFLEELHKDYKIVIFTARVINERGLLAVTKFMKENNLPYDDITSIKPYAIAYIDDRAITFTGVFNGLKDKIDTFIPWNKNRY